MPTPPMRVPFGLTQVPSFWPLGDIGQPDPAFYATYFDDFTQYVPASYTASVTGTGAVARVAGKGGLVTFTTNATTPLVTDYVSLQEGVAGFQLTLGLKLAYSVSITAADYLNPGFVFGLINTTATPFTAITDGIWIASPSGSNLISLNHAVGSVLTTVAVPVGTFSLVNNQTYNLTFALRYNGEIIVNASTSQSGQVYDQDRVNIGPLARITPATLTTAFLNPTVGVLSGTATSKVLTVDWQYAAMERVAA